jgi:beta-glucosidase
VRSTTSRVPLLALAAALAGAAPPSADLPYGLPVVLPVEVRSPPVDPRAPFTPTVVSLLEQLLPPGATPAQIDNALTLLTGGPNPTCHAVGTNGAPTGTNPAIIPLCWADAQGVNWLLGPGETTAPMQMIGLAASFDRRYANAWGQVEGREGRQLMVTGLLGPQADVSVFVNWRRTVNSSSGEDPFLGAELAEAQIHGIQGSGLMAQIKHFGPYNGTDERKNVTVPDQAMHEIVLPPFEQGVMAAGVASLMASYQLFTVESELQWPGTSLPASTGAAARAREAPPAIWPLGESHFSAEHPWLLTYVLRDLWGGKAAIAAPDYGGVHSTSAILQGLDMEPFTEFFGSKNPAGTDPTGSTCADASGERVACDAPGAIHTPGIPFPGSPPGGCGLAEALKRGALPLSVVKAALARMLYQQERFGMLGCDAASAGCSNPGGVGGDRSGWVRLPAGPASGAVQVGTRNGDAAIAELGAERGAVLLKNDGATLPITRADLEGGVAVTGGTAEVLVAAPFDEASTGFADRVAIGPLAQLQALSGRPAAFRYSPANDATGRAVPQSVLSVSRTAVTGYLTRTKDGGPSAREPTIDYTSVSGRGQLAPGSYTWTGYIHVPRADVYTFRFQRDASAKVSFALDGEERKLQDATSIYHGHYYGARAVPVSKTVAGYTEAGLVNEECHAGAPPAGHPPDEPPAPAPVARRNPCPVQLAAGAHAVSIRFETEDPASFRFAYSRAQGDIEDAADDARGKAMALVFVNDDQVALVNSQGGPDWVSDARTAVAELPPAQAALIEAVAAANPRTVVVLNTGTPVIVPWIGKVRSALEMWNAGQEGGTATARLLLGQANPSGHTPVTWPMKGTDTVYAYPEPAGGLYPGSTAGPHPERLNGLPDGSSSWTQGIYIGYRYYDKLGIPVRFQFGHGLSYTTFRYDGLRVRQDRDHATVTFTVRNTGKVAGTAVPQVYVGPAASVPPGVLQAVRSLRGFDRVELAPGESRQVSIALDPRSFRYWSSAAQSWKTAPGERELWVGEGLGDLRLSGTVRVEG